jgi:hypothetical protein
VADTAPFVDLARSLGPAASLQPAFDAEPAYRSEIAARLFLSQHTVRDHIRTVFDKVGVSSRAELVANLFAEHDSERAHADLVHVCARRARVRGTRVSARLPEGHDGSDQGCAARHRALTSGTPGGSSPFLRSGHDIETRPAGLPPPRCRRCRRRGPRRMWRGVR